MNNAQFRKLVLDTPARAKNPDDKPSSTHGGTPSQNVHSLGSKMRSSIPMTPRSVMGFTGVDFARQLAERDNALSQQKKFRSSAAPKGAKLPSGYRDRTRDRVSAEDDDKASRVQALEELWKLDQIDRATFEKLRDEIVGGDVGTTHLVKGLDFRLLERVRRGEDVLNTPPSSGKGEGGGDEEEGEGDVEEELEKLAEREIKPIEREKVVKKGEMAPPPLSGAVAGKKRTRDEILAELKAQREAAKAAAQQAQQPVLGPKFRKIGEPREKMRIERDERGREVLITVDADGRVKRKVKKASAVAEETARSSLLMPEKGAKKLGMDVPELPKKPPVEEPDEDIDIFEGVSADYNPFGDLGEDSESDSDSSTSSPAEAEAKEKAEPPIDGDAEEGEISSPPPPPSSSTKPSTEMPPPPPPPPKPSAPRNYFSTPTPSTTEPTSTTPANPLTDPTILAALRKASSLHPLSSASSSGEEAEAAAKAARRKQMLESHDRDAEDLDLGFGSSRFADGEEEEEGGEGKRVRLSEWGGGDGDEGGKGAGKGGGGKKERKRGGKKRKGDGNSARDVLAVLERRKEGGGK